MSYVVTGATGHVGSALVDYLLGESVPIRVVIRSETKAESFRSRNIDVALADLYDAQALTRAFQGAKAVFVMNPTDVQGSDMFQSARQVSQAFAQVIQTAQVQRVVVLSSWGAEQPTKTGNILTAHILEEQLKDTTSQIVFIRAASFMENWLDSISAFKAGYSPVIGTIFQRLNKKTSYIATNDIARVAAQYMIKPSNELNKLLIIELEAQQTYSPNDVAKIVGDLLQKPVEVASMTDEMVENLGNKLGWSKSTVTNMIELHRSIDDDTIGWTKTNDPNIIRIQGKLTFNDVLKQIL